MQISSFATLINRKILVPSPRTQYVAVEKDHLVDFLKPVLRTIYVDSDWYLLNNPDIVDAIDRGMVSDAADHYVSSGYYEHRMPYEVEVQDDWYLEQYPDVNEAVVRGTFASGREHYYVTGFKEGRLPYANFSLRLIGAP
jgi:hypothetical protein